MLAPAPMPPKASPTLELLPSAPKELTVAEQDGAEKVHLPTKQTLGPMLTQAASIVLAALLQRC